MKSGVPFLGERNKREEEEKPGDGFPWDGTKNPREAERESEG